MKKYTLFLLLTLLLAACSTVQPVSFERLEAADVSFPETVRRIAVVNNVPAFTPESHPGIISTWMEGDGPTATESLAEQIASTRYFESVLIADTALNRRQATGLEETLLPRTLVDTLTTALRADLLVSLDRVILHARPAVLFDDDLLLPLDGLEVLITPVVRVYLPGREAPMFTIAPSDSISWYAASHPTDSLVVAEASQYAGGIPIHHLLPHWQEIERHYYDGGQVNFRDAGVFVRENEWDQAAALWQQTYDRRKGRTARMAAFNLALYHEMRDEIPAAQEWIARALQGAKEGSAEQQQAVLYQLQLAHRAKEIGKLNAQMERFASLDDEK